MGESTCAVCFGPLPKRPKPRVVCDNPECLREARQYAALRSGANRHKIATAATHRKCKKCPKDAPPKPLSREYFDVVRLADDGSVAEFRYHCKECRREYARKRYVEDKEKILASQRERQARNRKDPEKLEAQRAYQREWTRKKRQQDPVAAQRQRDANRRYRQRVKADPERLQARRDAEKMNYRLRKERKGETVREVSREKWEEKNGYGKATKEKVRVSVVPLPPLIEMWKQRDPDNTDRLLAEQAGVTERRIGAILRGEQENVNLSTADKLLTVVGMPLELVYDEEELMAA